MKWGFGVLAPLFTLLLGIRPASAQEGPSRSEAWGTATTVFVVASAGTQLLMPRIFYSDPEVTVGWKARWHVSVLAPVMTQVSLTLLNEHALKDAFEDPRPGCGDTLGGENCETFGMLSTHSYAAAAALGHGAAVFVFDTLNWSGGRFNAGAFVGDVGLPFVLGTLTLVGRGVGEFESTDQILAGGGLGLASGFLTGMTYALMQRPECGYTGALMCW